MSYYVRFPARRPVPKTAFSFAPSRVPEHPDFAIGAYIHEPFLGLGQDPDPSSSPLVGPGGQPVARHMVEAILKDRGYTAVPTHELREYVRQQIITAGIGFGAGLTVGALLGPAVLTFVQTLLGRR